MGYLIFFACLFITFGPSLAIFILIIAKNPRLLILSVGSSFFWLISILLAGIWWYIIPPLREFFFWTILWSVSFQELFRFLFFKIYTKAEKGFFSQFSNNQLTKQTIHLTTHPDHLLVSLALGLGSGMIYCLVMYVSILWESTGPGTYLSPGCKSSLSLFTLSALYSLCFSILHIDWSIIAFDSYRKNLKFRMIGVICSHFIASFLTVLNLPGGSCEAGIVLIFLLTIFLSFITWYFVIKSNLMEKKINTKIKTYTKLINNINY
jgi:anterior pharynx defective protein 1